MSARSVVELVRHGAPEGGERFRGSRDDPLSPLGWAQLEAACAGGRWDRVVSSPLRRCAEFAQRLAAARGLPLDLEPAFREIGFGAWEGLTSAEVSAAYGEALHAYWRDPERNPPPGAEPVADFAARVAQAWAELLARCRGQRILVVAHGGTVRMVVRAVLGAPLSHCWRMRLPYATVTRIETRHHDGYDLPVLALLGGSTVAPD